MEIGARIAELRRKMGWTQAQLAEKIHVSDKAVSKWEQCGGYPELTSVIELARIFDVTIDYLLTGKVERAADAPESKDMSTAKDRVMRTGESIEARTHAGFLNELLGKSYKSYMKCGYNFDHVNILWMIRLNGEVSSTGWRNSLVDGGERIIESYIAPAYVRPERHKDPVFHHRRYVFDIIERTYGARSYVFRGVFEFDLEEGNNDHHVWNKVADEADFDELLRHKNI